MPDVDDYDDFWESDDYDPPDGPTWADIEEHEEYAWRSRPWWIRARMRVAWGLRDAWDDLLVRLGIRTRSYDDEAPF